MEGFLSFARKKDVVRLLTELGRDPAEYDIKTMSERWDNLKMGVALGAISLAPFLATFEKEGTRSVRKVEPVKKAEPPRAPFSRRNGGLADEEEIKRRVEEREKEIKRLMEKPWSELTPQEMKLLGYVW